MVVPVLEFFFTLDVPKHVVLICTVCKWYFTDMFKGIQLDTVEPDVYLYRSILN